MRDGRFSGDFEVFWGGFLPRGMLNRPRMIAFSYHGPLGTLHVRRTLFLLNVF